MTGKTSGSSNLKRVSAIDFAQLRQDAYFETLVQAAYNAGIVGDDEIKRIQLECLGLLAEKTKKYTSGSASFLIEDGEDIMKSNLYTIGLYLKSLPDLDCAIDAVKNVPIATLYSHGQTRIKIKINTARHLYHSVMKNITPTDYDYYNFTLQESIQQFFDLYTEYFTWYHAHELPAGIIFSYPVCFAGYIGDEELYVTSQLDDFMGIEYVQRYLQAIYYENSFCTCFTREQIQQVLHKYHSDYNSVVFNVYEKVLSAVVEYAVPEMELANKPPGEVELMLAKAYNKLVHDMDIKSAQVREYVKMTLISLAQRRSICH
ncbi:MAG: DUF6179 domain-containing protein [Defluviitaleaceae bacterium]|nr:DUF6179 domain-containing protein [Defluviitaleaceae bacterium]